MRITTALQKFLLQLQADGRSVFTIDQRRRHVLAFAAWLAAEHGTTDMSRISHETIAGYMSSESVRTLRDGRPRRATSANQMRTSLRAFFGYCEAAAITRTNPARLLKLARCSSAPPRTLSEGDCKRLMETLAADDSPLAQRDHMLFALMLGTGARLSSACAIERDDIDFGQREIRLRVTKGDRPAVVLFGRKLAAHLRRYCRGRGPGPLFPGRSSPTIATRQIRARLSLWLERAGIEGAVSPHGLRHTFAVNVYRKTGDLLVVREALAHASVQSSAIYARLDRSALRQALGA